MIELQTLHEAIARTLRAKVPGVLNIEAYPRLGDTVQLPALLFGLATMTPADDPGTGETAIRGHFQAVILVDPLQKDAPLQVATLAAATVVALRAEYWDCDFVEAPENIRSQPEEGTPELAGMLSWSVSWEQVFRLGEPEWPWEDDGDPPKVLVFGVDPGVDPPPADRFLTPEEIEQGKDP